MNLLDGILIALLGYCLIRGIFRGLIKELSSIVGVLGGFYAAYTYYPFAAKALSRWITQVAYVNIASFLAIFITVCIVVALIAAVIKYLMRIAFMGWVDRIGGAVVGTAKGAIIAIVMVLMLTAFLPSNVVVLKNSLVARHLMQVSATLVQVASKELKSVFMPKMKELNQTWKQKL